MTTALLLTLFLVHSTGSDSSTGQGRSTTLRFGEKSIRNYVELVDPEMQLNETICMWIKWMKVSKSYFMNTVLRYEDIDSKRRIVMQTELNGDVSLFFDGSHHSSFFSPNSRPWYHICLRWHFDE